MTATPARTHVILIIVQVMFATMSVVAKIVFRELPATGLVGFRAATAAIILVAITRAMGTWRGIECADRGLFVLAAFTGVVANQLLFMGGLERSTATNAVVLGTTIPLFTAAIAMLSGRERLRLVSFIGLLLAFGGALLVAGAESFDGSHRLGNAMIIVNCCSYAIFLVVAKRLVQTYDAMMVIAWCFVIGGAVLLTISAPILWRALPLSTTTWLGIAYIVIFATVGTYALNTIALRTAPASLVAAYVNLQVIVGAALAWVVLDERLGIGTIIGTPFIIIGLGMVSGWFVSRTK